MTSIQPCVLVCEDNEGITDVVKIVLETKGYRVVTIDNGANIKNIVKEVAPNVILMDLWLPGMNGDELAKILKADPTTRDIPLIIVSASRDAVEVAKEVGADDALKKPFDIGDLEKIVDKYIKKSLKNK